MPTTSNFGWTTPADTDLVKDGAAAIRTLGNGIDTSFLDLKGGTSGQVLSKASNTDLDFTWVAQDDSNAIQNALLTTTGDTIYASGASTPARLGIGSTGQVLTVSGGVPTWATPAGGGKVLQVVEGLTTTSTNIATTTLTDTTITATITPSSASSKVLVMVAAKFYGYRGNYEYTVGAVLLRGATIIADYDNNGDEFNKITAVNVNPIEQRIIQPIIKLDSPATTSAVTYKVQARVRYTTNSGQVTFQDESTPSTIILMEIGA
jgi:hypothetical protein